MSEIDTTLVDKAISFIDEVRDDKSLWDGAILNIHEFDKKYNTRYGVYEEDENE